MDRLVTVFGGSGFVGRYVVRALAKDGWRIRVALRRPALAPELKVMGDVGQVELVQANIRYPDSVARTLDGAEAVVNLVGVLYEAGRQGFEALHAAAPRSLGEQAAARGIGRFVQVSAIGADARSPSRYAQTKAAGEAAVRAAIPGAVVLRPSIVFGPEDDFFNRFGRLASMAPVLPLIGGGETRFQPVYAGDVGEAAAVVLRQETAAGRTYELGGPGVYSFRQLMEIVLRETQKRRPLVPVPTPLARIMGGAGDLQARLLPIVAPQITTDQVALLARDNVADPALPGLEALGVTPTALEAVLPGYMWKFRKGGQFAEPAPTWS
jgi:uncharacterized protein YbjT (DUF2867 family)